MMSAVALILIVALVLAILAGWARHIVISKRIDREWEEMSDDEKRNFQERGRHVHALSL